ncbi:MAG TPA: M20/M25/M40 family metallo-hydrolase [Methylomirabilota bacterium]|nr:M20/M25/M40 family metallo-hydrolase [Methylomirabilota bacterium]
MARTTKTERQEVYRRLARRFPEFVEELSTLARIPTISANREAEREGAEATARMLARYDVPSRLMAVPGGPPMVVGEVKVDAKAPVLILYNHYDVQPVDPLPEWTHDPFDPVVKDGRLYARGVADTKGNAVAQALAQAVIREVTGSLPVNLRFMIEGEEEVGSPHLPAFWRKHPGLFRGAGATIEAGGHTPEGRPELYMGSKGILYVELRARTAAVDQHSSLAAVLPNPAWRLIAALRTLRDERGRILIPGFYDGVARPTREDLAHLRKNRFDPASYKKTYGVREVFGGRTRLGRLRAYVYTATCNIDGIVSGFTGSGSKTINPAWAAVKLDFRLLPGQRPRRILGRLRTHLRRQGFGDLEVIEHSIFEPGASPISARIAQATIAGCREVYGQGPEVFPWMGGSSSTWFYTSRGTPAALPPGVGYSGSRIHAPNEHIRLDDARRALQAFAATMMLFDEGPRG